MTTQEFKIELQKFEIGSIERLNFIAENEIGEASNAAKRVLIKRGHRKYGQQLQLITPTL